MNTKTAAGGSKLSTNMKDDTPLLFQNGTEEVEGIFNMNSFHYFWIDLDIWVWAMLIECPEEAHDPSWYDKWEEYKKFGFDKEGTSSDLIKVCIMENTKDTFHISHLLERLTLQIPYLANHIYYNLADEEGYSAIIRMRLFQCVDFRNPYYFVTGWCLLIVAVIADSIVWARLAGEAA